MMKEGLPMQSFFFGNDIPDGMYPKGASFCVVCIGFSGIKVPPFGALERHFRGVSGVLSIFQL